MVVQKAAKFRNKSKNFYNASFEITVKYLLVIAEKGLTRELDATIELEILIDAIFYGEYDKNSPNDLSSVRSRTTFIITHSGYPLKVKALKPYFVVDNGK